MTTSVSAGRRRKNQAFTWMLWFAIATCLFTLAALLLKVSITGAQWLDMQFLTSLPSRFPEKAGIYTALIGSLWLITLTGLISIPLGIGAALYLEEFAPASRMTNFIQLNITNLAGVPSIVYGMLGLVAFVRAFSLPKLIVFLPTLSTAFPFVTIQQRIVDPGMGRSVIAGALTLSLLILPTIILASREALRAVPNSLRLAGIGLGATKWQTVRDLVLPASIPGIVTGVILSISRAIGETAPLIMIGALTYIAFTPGSIFDGFTALPIQVFNWASRPQHEFHQLAAAGIIVLLAVLFMMSFVAIAIRNRFQRNIKW